MRWVQQSLEWGQTPAEIRTREAQRQLVKHRPKVRRRAYRRNGHAAPCGREVGLPEARWPEVPRAAAPRAAAPRAAAWLAVPGARGQLSLPGEFAARELLVLVRLAPASRALVPRALALVRWVLVPSALKLSALSLSALRLSALRRQEAPPQRAPARRALESLAPGLPGPDRPVPVAQGLVLPEGSPVGGPSRSSSGHPTNAVQKLGTGRDTNRQAQARPGLVP
jgi:hypothetical protein